MAFWQWMGLAVTAAVLCLLVRQQQPQLGGLCAAAAVRAAVYLKGKNAKKYRHGVEYGSARWSA